MTSLIPPTMTNFDFNPELKQAIKEYIDQQRVVAAVVNEYDTIHAPAKVTDSDGTAYTAYKQQKAQLGSALGAEQVHLHHLLTNAMQKFNVDRQKWLELVAQYRRENARTKRVSVANVGMEIDKLLKRWGD